MESVEQQGWLEKISKTNSQVLEKTEKFNSQRGWLLNCFFLSSSNHENCSIKNICVYSKSKIKTKVTSKQNLEYFKMINRRLFIHKFCNNLKMLLSSSWTKFIRALVFSSSPRASFSSFEYLCFSFLLIFRFILIQYRRVKTKNNYIIIKIEKFQLCLTI